MNINKKKLIVIVGPTASGKTELAIKVSKIFNCDIISADSRQFYKEMSIGTAKPSKENLKEANHHFIDNISIKDSYTAGVFSKEVNTFLDQYFLHNNYIIIVGGSGLFIDSVIYGIDEIPKVPNHIRDDLNQIYIDKGIEYLLKKLKSSDRIYYDIVDKKNPRRIIRALEVCMYSDRPYSSYLSKKKKIKNNYVVDWYGICPDKETLISRINSRVDEMVNIGLFNEVEQLKNFRHLNALKSVGYSEIFKYFDEEVTKNEAIENIKINTRKYSKRQMTWFNRNKEIKWFRNKQDFINYFNN
jgi:tRNA dimethylallyltransferase|tara:strand:- start:267 stop:1166 length:900 start_codon:yes stop_codon:yes gene_type:complete